MPNSLKVEIFLEGRSLTTSCSFDQLASLTGLHSEEIHRVRSVIISRAPIYTTHDSIRYQSTDPNAPNFRPPTE